MRRDLRIKKIENLIYGSKIVKKSISLKKEEELHIFDFDGTLFRSPRPPFSWEEEWWSNIKSLSEPCVPLNPDDSWWIESTVRDAKKSIKDSKIKTVLLTGRINSPELRSRIIDLLAQKDLYFDKVILAGNLIDETSELKKEYIKDLVQDYISISKIVFWDDRPVHLRKFKKLTHDLGLLCETNLLVEKPKDPLCNLAGDG